MVKGSLIADFSGSWDVWRSFSGKYLFKMFVDHRLIDGQGIERIRGHLKDNYGLANFEAEITSEEIKIAVDYNLEAIVNGGPKETITVHVKFVKGIYQGIWTDSEGVKRDFVLEKENTFFRDYPRGSE